MFRVDDVLHCDLKRSLDLLLTIALFHDVAENKMKIKIYKMRPKVKTFSEINALWTT